jgi:transcriptional regulator with XRE-family HTH domain
MLLVTPGSVSGWLRGARPYDRIVDRLCAKLGLREKWLTKGEGEPYPPDHQPSTDTDRRFQHHLDDISERLTLFEMIEKAYETLICDADAHAAGYRDQLRQFRIQFRRDGERRAKQQLRVKQNSLQKSITRVSNAPMAIPLTISQLLKRVALAVAEPGAKKTLAAAVGVTPQHLSAWLSGEFRPGGEATLKMLAWVQAKEAQQKQDPEGAQTPPGPTTQLRRSREEQPKSDQGKASHKGTKRTTKKR